MLTKILGKLDVLTEEVSGFKSGQDRLTEEVYGLKSDQANLTEQVDGLNAGQAKLIENVSGLKTGQVKLTEEVKEVRHDIKNLDEKMTLLTKQTSNAIIEHYSTDINFLTEKVVTLEKEIYVLKEK